MGSQNTLQSTSYRVGITIPANGSPATIRSLIEAVDPTIKPLPEYPFKVLGYVPAGTLRGAFFAVNSRSGAAYASGDTTTHGEYVPESPDPWFPTCERDLSTLVHSTTAATVSAVVVLLR